jgi:bifunctional UDP-N-acetylglucosamine pyrophosphorylase/glucosamine-1-phosphate N-acetyltransferase
LAAGESSRFWPICEGRHKSLFCILGKPLIQWTLEALQGSGIDEAVIVQAPNCAVEEALEDARLDLKIRYVVQESPKGMGDALLTAQDGLDEQFLLVHAHQFTADRWVGEMLLKSQSSGAELILAGQPTEEPWKYGMLRLEGDRALGIVEKPTSDEAPSDVRALGIYLLPRRFLDYLDRVEEHQYSFEGALAQYMGEHEVRVVIREEPAVSLKHPWDLFSAVRLLMDEHLESYEAPTAQISPLAHIEGKVHIGESAKVYEYAVIKGPCYIGEGCIVGTHALVREYVDLEPGVTIGAHAEVARSLFQRGASTHSGYFGDSIFDRGARAGAGTLTANVKAYRDEIKPLVQGRRVPTGLSSLGVIVGAEAQLGIGVKTMPGVMIGARSFIGPGTIVSENVPSNTRYYVKQEKISKVIKRKRNPSR